MVLLEGHAAAEWADGLTDRGHRVVHEESFSSAFGHAHAIVMDDQGCLHAAADPRTVVGSAAQPDNETCLARFVTPRYSLARSSSSASSTLAPRSRSSVAVNSARLWLRPFADGTKIIAVGHTRASICAS